MSDTVRKIVMSIAVIVLLGGSLGLNIAQAQQIKFQERLIDGYIADLYQQLSITTQNFELSKP